MAALGSIGGSSSKSHKRRTNQIMAEPLEHRRMFDASPITTPQPAMPDSVPIAGPMVLHAEFDARNAPHELRVTFSDDVWASLDGSDLVLINEANRFVIPGELITVNWDFATNTARFVLVRVDGGVLPEGNWHATLPSEGVIDSEGRPLDGDGDFLLGGDFNFEFSFIRGDANQDGIVDMLDFNAMAANFGQTSRNFAQGDFNYDNKVDLRDMTIFASRYGTNLSNASSTFGQNAIDADTAEDALF